MKRFLSSKNQIISNQLVTACLTTVVTVFVNHLSAFAATYPIEKMCASGLKNTEIIVSVDKPNVVFDLTKTTFELTSMKSSGGKGTTLGLTRVRKEFGIKSGMSMMPLPDGRMCARPGFRVSIQLNPQKVFVASEFPKGTCAFKQIIDHEMKHVKVNQSHAEFVAKTYEREMRKAFANKVFYGSKSSLETSLIRIITSDWLPHLREEIKKAELLQKRIDTKQEYDRMGVMCGGAVPKVLSSYVYDEN